MKKLSATLIALFALASSAMATTKTVTLFVAGMDCAMCPITVKKAITKVNGVSSVNVDFDKKQAVVVFDDAKTTVSALTDATKNAGYPASVKP